MLFRSEDGCFLAYKGVNDDYTDVHTGKIINRVGRTVTMERNRISDDPSVGCHTGLHVGSEDYATGFGSRTVICKVNPRDVVSVPLDCECQKMRVCEYSVTADYTGSMRKHYSDSSDGRSYSESEYDWSDEDETGAESWPTGGCKGSNGHIHQV